MWFFVHRAHTFVFTLSTLKTTRSISCLSFAVKVIRRKLTVSVSSPCSGYLVRSLHARDVSYSFPNPLLASSDWVSRSCCQDQGLCYCFLTRRVLTRPSVTGNYPRVLLARSQEEQENAQVPMINSQRVKRGGLSRLFNVYFSVAS